MKKMQQQFKGDRQKLNEAMMKLYQEHKVNPLASCNK
ncbi:MAG: YidC/Oxa1 family membrane protein insertase [Acidimicrobiaceae bacterium]